jgi:hypothetical protein
LFWAVAELGGKGYLKAQSQSGNHKKPECFSDNAWG